MFELSIICITSDIETENRFGSISKSAKNGNQILVDSRKRQVEYLRDENTDDMDMDHNRIVVDNGLWKSDRIHLKGSLKLDHLH